MFHRSHAAILADLAGAILFLLRPAPMEGSEIRLLAGSVITSQTAAGQTHPVAISADGRYVLLRSSAPNLVHGQVDTNGGDDLFLRDRSSGAATLITHAAGAPVTSADQGSWPVAMSPDGEWVLFTSWAGDLMAGLEKAAPYSSDVFLWRRSTGTFTLVSHLPGSPLHAAGSSRAVAMTPDGAFVVFDSEASGLVAGVADTNGAFDVFLFSRESGSVALVSAAGATAATGNAASTGVDLSADGAAVFFNSSASNLVAGDTNQRDDAFVRVTGFPVGRLMAGSAETVARDVTPDGRRVLIDLDGRVQILDRQSSSVVTIAADSAHGLALSADGSRALFESFAGTSRTYLHVTGRSPLCLNCLSELGGGGMSLSADGRFAVYGELEENGFSVAHLYDAATAISSPVLPAGTTGQATGSPAAVGMSQGAAVLVMAARDSEVIPGIVDRNGNYDAFAIRRDTGKVDLMSSSSGPSPIAATLGNSSHPTGSSPDGEEILFRGPADLLAPGQPSDDVAAWAYRVADGERRLLSPLPGQPQIPASGWLQPVALGQDGRVLLLGTSTDLVPSAQPSTTSQLYLYLPAKQNYRLITARAGLPAEGTAAVLEEVRAGRSLGSQVLLRASSATDLVAGLAPLSAPNLFSCDLGGAGCRLLSADMGDPLRGADAAVEQLRASADAAVAVFASTASNLFSGAGGLHSNTFRWREGSGLELLSRSAADPQQAANNATWPAAISADGRFALANALATDLDPAALDGNGMQDVFLVDLEAGSWELVSGGALDPNAAAAGFSWGLSISDDGRFVLFFSSAADLVPGVTQEPAPAGSHEAAYNLFVYDRNSRRKRLVSHLPGQSLAAAGYSSYFGYLSRDGSRVAFETTSPSLVPEGAVSGLYLWDGDLQQVGLGRGGPYLWPGLFPIFLDSQDFDGSLLPFWSFNDNLTPGDTNGWGDAYVALLDGLFRDGFESGGTGAWSSSLP